MRRRLWLARFFALFLRATKQSLRASALCASATARDLEIWGATDAAGVEKICEAGAGKAAKPAKTDNPIKDFTRTDITKLPVMVGDDPCPHSLKGVHWHVHFRLASVY